MDINSLLSPADSPADETPRSSASPSARASPLKRPGRPSAQTRKSSGLSQQYSPSPRVGEPSLPSIAAHNAAAAYQGQQGIYSQSNPNSPLQQPVYQAPTSTPPAHNLDPRHIPHHPSVQRHGSTPQMDTLADLASMQRQQHSSPSRASPAQDATSSGYTLQNLPRPSLSARSSNEIVMTDPTTQERRTYKTHTLSEGDCRTLNDLGNRLVANPFDYTSHVEFIRLLQHGLAVHVSTTGNPRTYELLTDLRDARINMDQQFPLGESLWISWLDDEISLAKNAQERLRVMEFFNKAISDEPSSIRIWRKYGDYAYYLWATAYGVDEAAPSDPWSANDMELGKEYFKWEPMLRTWEEGVANTHTRLNDSHLVWDQYIGVLIQDHGKWPDNQKVENIKQKFFERLQEAHATWEDTFQSLGQFLTKNDPNNYEGIMKQMSTNQGPKTAWRIRESHEMAIQKAAESGDETTEYNAYTDYLNWELQKKGVFSFRLINSLYERACIRFPSVQQVWVDYIDFLIGDTTERDFPIMQVIERATRHCPWSGDLWAHRLLTMESEGQPFVEIEKIKHRATSTGLLDVGGMEELMKVYVAWCGGLRRRAFALGASEDDTDIAEVAIRSALEHVKKIGQDKYGEKFTGDPYYRLERIYIKFMMQKGEIDVARDSWDELKPNHCNSYDFWYRLYIWEMVAWAKFSLQDSNDRETQLKPPESATKILLEALDYVDTLDWPEQLVPMYLNHCEHHESVAVLRRAVIKSREINKQIAKRREKEQADAAAASAQQVQTVPVGDLEQQTNGKRKRSEEPLTETLSTKKAKSNEAEHEDDLQSEAPLKRDREHTTIIVENIPAKATERQIGRFFEECGTIKSLKLVEEKNTRTATIEFETQDEASYSLMKAGKVFNGNELEVKFGTGCTVYVTNYPPEADKAYLGNLFKDCGEVVDIRLPSLKANTKRRFAYVQFLDPDQALKATQLNGTILSGKYKLVAAISDPNKAKEREGAQMEGREVFVGNVYWFATEDELKQFFEPAGEILSARIPRNAANKSKGSAFICFKTKEGADKAVEKFNNAEFRGRALHVEISNTKKLSRIATNIHRGSTASPGPDAQSPSMMSDVPNGGASVASTSGDNDGNHHIDRTIALFNVPDTVTAARLEKICGQYGEIKKFQLRPDHGGAIVEYVEVQSVGKAEFALEDYELEDQKLHVGKVPDLLKQKVEFKEHKNWAATKSKKASGPAPTARPLARPSQPGRGGRGAKRGGGLGFTARKPAAAENANENADAGPKSNDYFRNLMAGGATKEQNAAPKASTATKEDKTMDQGDDGLSDIMVSDAEDGGVEGTGDDEGEPGLLDDIMA